MSRTRIKFCGMMRPEDALLAARCGADAIGIIQYPKARRYVAVDVAKSIVRALPPFVTPVAVFVDESVEAMRRIAQQIGVRTLQLHGEETPDVIAELSEFTIVKSVKVSREHFASTLKGWKESIRKFGLANLQGLLLETAGTAESGGSGVANDWATVRDSQIAGLWNDLPALIAAGGLTPETVGDVVANIKPFAVDVSSGVESSHGVKSPQRIADFVRAVSSVGSV